MVMMEAQRVRSIHDANKHRESVSKSYAFIRMKTKKAIAYILPPDGNISRIGTHTEERDINTSLSAYAFYGI